MKRRKEKKNVFQGIAERWFLTEPALFAVYCSHRIVANDGLKCVMRSGKGRIEYNPVTVAAMTEGAVDEHLRAEMIRILLKHPYERKPYGCSNTACTLGSDCVLSSYYRWKTVAPAKPSDFSLPDSQNYEWYAVEIEKRLQHEGSSGTAQQPQPDAGDGNEKQDNDGDGKDNEDNGNGKDGGEGKGKPEKGNEDKGNPGNGNEGEGKPGKGGNSNDGEGDSTSGSTSPTPQQSELWEEDSLMQAGINDIISQTTSWGTIPGDLIETIIASTQARVDYRKVLSGFRASIISTRRNLTRMRPNRRTGFQNMGSLYRFRTNLLVGIDVSGSVTSKTLAHVYSVINRFFRYGVENIDTVQFDCRLGPVRNYRKAAKRIEVAGRGGTDFQPVVDYACEKQYDGLIIFTDGYAPPPDIPRNTRTRLMWVCQDDRSFRAHYPWMRKTGRVCVIYY